MSRSLRIAVADDEPRMRQYYKEVLPLLGHQVVGAASTGAELVEQCRSTQPDLIITDIRMPDMDGIDAAAEVCRNRSIPVSLVSAYHDSVLIARAEQHHVMSYLVKPIKSDELQPAIAIAIRRFEEFQAMSKEATDLRQALQDRKLIERAKGLLMKRAGLDEYAAFRRLQEIARSKNRTLRDVADMIVSLDETYRSAGDGSEDSLD